MKQTNSGGHGVIKPENGNFFHFVSPVARHNLVDIVHLKCRLCHFPS